MEGRIRTSQGVFVWLEGISLTVSLVVIVPLQLPKLVLLPLAASMMSSWSLVLPVANFHEHVMWQAVIWSTWRLFVYIHVSRVKVIYKVDTHLHAYVHN